jgi:hypothetical protein
MSLHGFKLQTFRFRAHTPNVKCSNLWRLDLKLQTLRFKPQTLRFKAHTSNVKCSKLKHSKLRAQS